LKELADNGLIPSLVVNEKLRFNPSQVQDALNRLAEKRGQKIGGVIKMREHLLHRHKKGISTQGEAI
jgi:cobyric acid synthase